MADVPRVAVILAGGSGERFWPLSTADRPKQLLDLGNTGKSLLEESLSRAESIVGKQRTFVVTGERIASAIKASGLLDRSRLLVEPSPKNTLGALCWTIVELKRLGYGDETLVAILTADHAISGLDKFQENVRTALRLAEERSAMVTIGIPPTRAETGFGYVHLGEPVDGGFQVRQFVEKPDAETAERYWKSGDYLWNSGMFFWMIGAFVSELRRHRPEVAVILDRLSSDPAAFEDLPGEPIDKALMERSQNIVVVAAEFDWDDVGSWDALARTHPADENGNVLTGTAVEIDARNNIVFSDGIPIGIIGVEGLIVVATSNGILVCERSQAQRVREILTRLKARD